MHPARPGVLFMDILAARALGRFRGGDAPAGA
jgi:hypothetical protein